MNILSTVSSPISRPSRPRLLRGLLGAAFLALTWAGSAASGRAQITDWNGTGDWTNGGDWNGGVPTSASSASIESGTVTVSTSTTAFDRGNEAAGSGIIIATNGTLTITNTFTSNGTVTIASGGTLTADQYGNNGTLTIQSGGTLDVTAGYQLGSGTLILGNGITFAPGAFTLSSTSATVEVDGTDTATIATSIDELGGDALKKTGIGTLILTGAGNYVGPTTITAGTLQIGNGTNGSLNSGTAITIASGAALALDLANNGSFSNTVTDNGTVIGAEGSVITNTLSSSLTGTGGITQSGAGMTVLLGTNSQTGTTTITAGTLELGNDSPAATTAALVINGGILELNGWDITVSSLSGTGGTIQSTPGQASLTIDQTSGTDTYAGSINSTSYEVPLIKQGAGTLILTGTNSAANASDINQGGTLEFGTLVSLADGNLSNPILDTDSGAITAFAVSSTDSTYFSAANITTILANQNFFSGAILGLDTSTAGGSFTYGNAITDTNHDGTNPLGLAKLGTGTLILTGANTYSGGTQVDAGTLEVDNTTGSGTGTGAVSVASGATLLGTGTVGGIVSIASGGTLGAGTASTIGALAIGGTLTLNPGSTTALRIEGTTAGVTYDQINVTGAVTLGGTLSLSYGGFTPVVGESFNLITSASGFSGNFTSIVNPLANALIFTSSYDASDFTLSVTAVQTSFTSFAQNPNQLAVARNLNTVSADPRETALIAYLNDLHGTALPAAFVELSPIQQTSVTQNSLSVSRAAFGTLENRLSAVRSGSNGLSLSQFNLIDQNIPAASLIAGTDLPTNVKAFTPAPDNRWGFFAAANGDFGAIDGGSLSPDSSYHGAGFTLGSDYRVTPQIAVGFAAGYDWNKTDFDDSGSNVVANSIRFGPYATWKDKGGDWIDGTLGGAYHWYESARDTLGGMADSHSNGTEFDTSLKYGHDFKAGEWTLTPTFGFDYLHLDIGGYNESGSLAPLAVEDQQSDSFRSNLGGQIAHSFKWKGVAWNPYVQAGWAHEFLDAADAVSARFASGAGDVFTTQGQSIGHDSATFGAGLSAALTDAVTANLSYSGEANGQYQDHSFNVSVRVQF